ncbi:D-alanine--D-alanine ligase [Flavobacterium sp.]|jgi:hypothetical protein|uniref:D-alanine--D-alanine ligase n=1 Tax=Flavobacterium sp. TaxID=239 RepID=UPI0040484A9B
MKKTKLLFHKIKHWEYWPYQIVYLPVYFQYLYYAVKAKSFFFFNASNPSIKNGGFFMESKKEIYDLIPQEYYPKTILFKVNTPFKEIREILKKNELKYPLIGKPDIGLRGTAVKKINSEIELLDYSTRANFDFLIQGLIPFHNEIGLFYVRLPNEEKGIITGIVQKEFMIINGDGKKTIKEHLEKDPRYLFQIEALEKEYKEKLNTVLNAEESINLVPYGNHCRGTKFIDASHQITPKLVDRFNLICEKIEGFHFGRMDIMFNTYEELENGENFKIVEINGAISEPTHIYDPQHSLLYGWKELTRHFKYMYEISIHNKKKGAKYLTFKEGVKEFKKHHEYYDTILKF